MKIQNETKDGKLRRYNIRTEDNGMEITKLVLQTTIYNHVCKQTVTVHLYIIIGHGYPLYEVLVLSRQDGCEAELTSNPRFTSLEEAQKEFIDTVTEYQQYCFRQVFGEKKEHE